MKGKTLTLFLLLMAIGLSTAIAKNNNPQGVRIGPELPWGPYSPKPRVSPKQQNVGIIVGNTLYSQIESRLSTYMNDVENNFEDVTLNLYTGNWDSPESLRAFIADKYSSDNLTGVVLVGLLPYAMWEWTRNPDDDEVCPIPIFYEDLDGNFTDEDSDGLYDHYYLGSGEPHEGPEIWACLMRPPEDDEVGALQAFLDKCHDYYTNHLFFPKKASVYISHDWWSSTSVMVSHLTPIYGSGNVDSYGGSNQWTQGLWYRDRLATGYEMNVVWSHSSSWFHQFDGGKHHSNMYTSDVKGVYPGGVITVIWGCHAADFDESPIQNLAVNYCFGPSNGLASMGATRSIGFGPQETIYDNLRDGATVGVAFYELIDQVYKVEFLEENIFIWYPEERDKFVWDYALIGNPFISTVGDMSGTPGSISGVFMRDDGVTPAFSGVVEVSQGGATKGRGIVGEDGGYLVNWLKSGTYDVEASDGYISQTITGQSVVEGAQTDQVNFFLHQGELIFPRGYGNYDVSWKWVKDTTPGSGWNSDLDYDDSGWNNGVTPFELEYSGGTEVDFTDLYLRKQVEIGTWTSTNHHYILRVASDDGADVWVNGTRVIWDSFSWHGFEFWDYSCDIGSYLGEGPNLLAIYVHDNGGGNHFDAELYFDDDRPTAEIFSPLDGSTVSGIVPIVGSATDVNFDHYKLEYGVGADPGSWIQIGDSSPTPVINDILAHWNTLGLEQGIYSLRLTAEDTEGNLRQREVVVGVDTTIGGPNLLANPGFEDEDPENPGNPSSWSTYTFSGSPVFVWDTTTAHSGSYSAKIEQGSADEGMWWQWVDLYPSTRYLLGGWIKTENVAGPSGVKGACLAFWDAAEPWEERSTGAFKGTHDWTYRSVEATTKPEQTGTWIEAILGYGGAASGEAWWDDIELMQLSPTPPTDLTATSTPGGISLNWTASIPGYYSLAGYRIYRSYNLLSNPDFESGTAGIPDDWENQTWSGNPNYVWDNGISHSGSNSVKIEAPEGDTVEGDWHQEVGVEPNTQYLLFGWIRTDTMVTNDPDCWYRGGAALRFDPAAVPENWWEWHTELLEGTNDWTLRMIGFTTRGAQDSVKIQAIHGCHAACSGTSWYDDLGLAKFELLGSVGPNDTTYLDTGISPGTTYCYVVTAYDSQEPPNESAYSQPVTAEAMVGIGREPTTKLPAGPSLAQNYPNPFNATTAISYRVPAVSGQRSAVSLKVYNLLGQRVRTLVEGYQKPGYYRVCWDGRDDRGKEVCSGIYLYQLIAGGFRATRKLVIIK